MFPPKNRLSFRSRKCIRFRTFKLKRAYKFIFYASFSLIVSFRRASSSLKNYNLAVNSFISTWCLRFAFLMANITLFFLSCSSFMLLGSFSCFIPAIEGRTLSSILSLIEGILSYFFFNRIASSSSFLNS